MTMAFPARLRVGKRSLRWSGGGLLALISLGLHGVLLGFPLAQSDPASPDLTAELDEPVEVIDVVRLPADWGTAAPEVAQTETVVPAASAPQVTPPTAASQGVASQGAAPVAPVPQAAAPVPAPSAPVDLGPLPPAPPPQTLGDRLRDPAAYVFNNLAKTAMAEGGSLEQQELSTYTEVAARLLERAMEQGITDDDRIPMPGEKLAPLVVVYPLNTCLVPPPAEGMVLVVADTAGQRLQRPELLYSTGYSVFDDKAIEMAMRQVFPAQPAGSPRPNPRGYWLPVQVQYNADGCNT